MSNLPRSQKVRQMLDAIESEYAYAGRFTGLPAADRRVLSALAEVPREEFVPVEMRPYAYDNRALPIEAGQTISQPFIVALMTHLLEPETEDIILEIGTGSGYQSAILSRMVRKIYSIEIIEALAQQARRRLARLGLENIEIRVDDGQRGWPEQAPFDGIMVTAAAPRIPPALIEQLKRGARLVIPVRKGDFTQELVLVAKGDDGSVTTRDVLSVAFVPLTGGDAPGK